MNRSELVQAVAARAGVPGGTAVAVLIALAERSAEPRGVSDPQRGGVALAPVVGRR